MILIALTMGADYQKCQEKGDLRITRLMNMQGFT